MELFENLSVRSYVDYVIGWRKLRLDKKDFCALDLTECYNAESRTELKELGLGYSWFEEETITVEGIPFAVKPNGANIVATTLGGHETVTVPVGMEASEVWMLMAARFVGEEEPSRGVGPIVEIGQVDRFMVELIYANGDQDQFFPFDVKRASHTISQGIAAYAIVPRRYGQIKEIKIRDTMDQGQFCVAAITLNTGKERILKDYPRDKPSVKAKRIAEKLKEISPSVTLTNGAATLENTYLACRLSTKDSLKLEEIVNKYVKVNCLGKPERAELFIIKADGTMINASDFKVGKVEKSGENVLKISLHSERREAPLTAELKLEVTDCPEIAFSLKVKNMGEKHLRLGLFHPVLGGLMIGSEAEDNCYMYPRRGAIINNKPITSSAPYSGMFPIQIMDIYNPKMGGGIYIRVEDLEDIYKYFAIEKSLQFQSDGTLLKVSYMERDIKPGESICLPRTIVGVHTGDWHEAMYAYRKWVDTWYKPISPRKQWFREVFNFRQSDTHSRWDYVVEGTKRAPYIYDYHLNKYLFDETIEEASKAFGGCDYIHVFDWAGSFTDSRYGIGDYTYYPERGGAVAFREAIKRCQAKRVPVGLYIEGYLVRKDTTYVGRTRAKDWNMLGPDGKEYGYFSSGNHWYYFMCPNVPEWQDYYSKMAARVVQDLDVSGVYVDEHGFGDPSKLCYNPAHDHEIPAPPVKGELEFMKKLRMEIDKVKKDVALYTEETPCDYNSQFHDGSFTYNIASVTDKWSPSHINLFRFYYPDFKTFEIICCDRPVGTNMAAVKRVFFNGEGIWLQGPAEGGFVHRGYKFQTLDWWCQEAKDYVFRMYKIIKEHVDAFTSLCPEPLIETEMADVYANKFPGDGKVIYTVLNGGYGTVGGVILKGDHKPGCRYVELWDNRKVEAKVEGDKATLSFEIHPGEVLCVAQLPAR